MDIVDFTVNNIYTRFLNGINQTVNAGCISWIGLDEKITVSPGEVLLVGAYHWQYVQGPP